MACAALISYQGHSGSSAANGRTERQERLGSQISQSAGSIVAKPDASVVLDAARDRTTSAVWSMSKYEFTHVLPHANGCAMRAYVVGPHLTGGDPAARATLTVDGERIATIPFRGRAADFPVERGRLAPAGYEPSAVAMTPLYNPYGLVFPMSARFCRAPRWDVGISLQGASWAIERVGIIATYVPQRETSAAHVVIVTALALVESALLIFAIHALFDAVVRRFGLPALVLTLVVFLCAVVTHDEWDFPAWLRITDVVAFGHGDPAYMWAGSPLWPYLLALPAPLLAATYALTGDGSQEISGLALKLAMALAMCCNAYVLARIAPRHFRAYVFPIVLLSPFALYELGAGYRELFAGTFALAGCTLCLRKAYVLAAFAFALAASISESLLPLLLLPMTLDFAERRSLVRAALDAVAGIGPLAVEWAFLVPHSVVTMTVATRITDAYRFGGGSWYSSLDGFRLLPPYVGTHSLLFVAAIFAVLGVPLVVRLVREVWRPAGTRRAQQRIFGAFVGLIAAFFLAYRGVDPSTWYTLLVVTAFYFLRFDPFDPLPLLLTVLQAFAFYTILGIGDFANWTYLAPENRSLLGVLGRPGFVSVLAVNATVLALYVAMLARNESLLFGRGSAWFLVLFFAAATTSAIRWYPIDIVFCAAVAVLVSIVFARLLHARERSQPWCRLRAFDYAGAVAIVASASAAGTFYGAAALVGFVAFALTLAYGAGLCDVVLALAGTLLLGSQNGYGYVSIAGWIALSIIALATLRATYAALHGTKSARDLRPHHE